MTMTYKQAAAFAGCSISTLKRYECTGCNQLALYQLTKGCGAIYEKCNPLDKLWPSKKQKPGIEISEQEPPLS